MKCDSDFFTLYEDPERRHLVKPLRTYEEDGKTVKVYPPAAAHGVSVRLPFRDALDDE